MRLLLVVLSTLATFVWGSSPKPNPSNFDRNWRCPNKVATIPPGYHRADATTPLRDIVVDATTLSRVAPASMGFNNSVVIQVKRTEDGTPYVKYYTQRQQHVQCTP